MAGWVYVMTNKDLPGRVKVGYTERHPYARLQELDQAGLPHAHVMAYAARVAEPYQLEQRVHHALAACHYNKEWFTCSVDDATATIQEYAGLIEREIIDGRESSRLPIPKKPVAPPPPAQPETIPLPEESAEDVPIPFWKQPKTVWKMVKEVAAGLLFLYLVGYLLYGCGITLYDLWMASQ